MRWVDTRNLNAAAKRFLDWCDDYLVKTARWNFSCMLEANEWTRKRNSLARGGSRDEKHHRFARRFASSGDDRASSCDPDPDSISMIGGALVTAITSIRPEVFLDTVRNQVARKAHTMIDDFLVVREAVTPRPGEPPA